MAETQPLQPTYPDAPCHAMAPPNNSGQSTFSPNIRNNCALTPITYKTKDHYENLNHYNPTLY